MKQPYAFVLERTPADDDPAAAAKQSRSAGAYRTVHIVPAAFALVSSQGGRNADGEKHEGGDVRSVQIQGVVAHATQGRMAEHVHCLCGTSIVPAPEVAHDGTTVTCDASQIKPHAPLKPGTLRNGVFTVLDVGAFGASVHDGYQHAVQGLDFAFVVAPKPRTINGPAPSWSAQRRKWLLGQTKQQTKRRWFELSKKDATEIAFYGDALSDTGAVFVTGEALAPVHADTSIWLRVVTPCGATTAVQAHAVSSALIVAPRPHQVVPQSGSLARCIAHASVDVSIDGTRTWYEAPRDGAWRTAAANSESTKSLDAQDVANTRHGQQRQRYDSDEVGGDDFLTSVSHGREDGLIWNEASCAPPPSLPSRFASVTMSGPNSLTFMAICVVLVSALGFVHLKCCRRRHDAASFAKSTTADDARGDARSPRTVTQAAMGKVIPELRDRSGEISKSDEKTNNNSPSRLDGMVIEARVINAYFEDD